MNSIYRAILQDILHYSNTNIEMLEEMSKALTHYSRAKILAGEECFASYEVSELCDILIERETISPEVEEQVKDWSEWLDSHNLHQYTQQLQQAQA